MTPERKEEIRREWSGETSQASVHSGETVRTVRELLTALDEAEAQIERMMDMTRKDIARASVVSGKTLDEVFSQPSAKDAS